MVCRNSRPTDSGIFYQQESGQLLGRTQAISHKVVLECLQLHTALMKPSTTSALGLYDQPTGRAYHIIDQSPMVSMTKRRRSVTGTVTGRLLRALARTVIWSLDLVIQPLKVRVLSMAITKFTIDLTGRTGRRRRGQGRGGGYTWRGGGNLYRQRLP